MKIFFSYFLILFLGIITVMDLLHPGFAVTHDGQDHIARIANFYLNLEQGVFIPRWAANLNWGYGHPILEFLYPFPSYIASLFHVIGFSFINATKLVYALATIASGITMFVFLKRMWGNTAGILGGLMYMYAPYHFVDLYVRGDIGELVAFVFVPLVFLGFFDVSRTRHINWVIFTSINISLLILSHNAVALMFTPLLLCFGIYRLWLSKWDRGVLVRLLLSFVLGFLLSGFFWIPALLEGQYTLRNIVTKGQYITKFVTLGQLFYGKWSYGQTGQFSVQLGLLHLLALIVGAILLIRKRGKQAIGIAGLLLFTIAAIFLMLPQSNFLWERIMLLQNFQFPWRFLAIPMFTLSLLGGYVVSFVLPKKQWILLVIGVVALVFLSKDYMHAKAYAMRPESFFTGIYNSTTDTGESSPIWSTRFMGQRFSKPLEVISGSATITSEKRLTTNHSYLVVTTKESHLLENTLYFPGWKVLVDGKSVPVEFQNPMYRGLMTFFVPAGSHKVSVVYQESRLRILGDIVSCFGIILLIGILVFQKKIL